MFVYLVRVQPVLIAWCIYKSEAKLISGILVFISPVGFGFPQSLLKYYLRIIVILVIFSCYYPEDLLIWWQGVRKGQFLHSYNYILVFSDRVLLTCDCHKCSSVLFWFYHLGKIERQSCLLVGNFPFPRSVKPQ